MSVEVKEPASGLHLKSSNGICATFMGANM